MPPDGIPMTAAMRQARSPLTDRLRLLAEEAGIEFRPPSLIPNSRPALEAAEFARDAGCFDAFHAAVFSALFEHDRNIGDLQVLVELADETGLDGKAVEEALKTHRYRDVVIGKTVWARERGITSTPTFIFSDQFELVGAQEYAVFDSVAQRMGARKRD